MCMYLFCLIFLVNTKENLKDINFIYIFYLYLINFLLFSNATQHLPIFKQILLFSKPYLCFKIYANFLWTLPFKRRTDNKLKILFHSLIYTEIQKAAVCRTIFKLRKLWIRICMYIQYICVYWKYNYKSMCMCLWFINIWSTNELVAYVTKYSICKYAYSI